MAVTNTDIIEATEYNNLVSTISSILGNGEGQSGYGQIVASRPVSYQTVVTAADMENLKTDIDKISGHQTGVASVLTLIDEQDIIGADAIGGDTTKGYNRYISIVQTLSVNKALVDPTQLSLEAGTSSTRSSPWNGNVSHSFIINFDDEDHRRHFFNAGGEIVFSASISGDSSSKGVDWQTMFNNMDKIRFTANGTIPDGTGSGTANGNFQLTSSYKVLYSKSGQNAAYAENEYRIRGRTTAGGAGIQFEVRFADNDTGTELRRIASGQEKSVTGFTAPNRLTVPSHNLTDGEYVLITDTTGVADLNSDHYIRVIDANTVELFGNFAGTIIRNLSGTLTNNGLIGPLTGEFFDENVEGTLTSLVQQNRPTGSFVAVPTPTYSNTNEV